MESLSLFETIFEAPIYNTVVLFLKLVPDLGIVIILTTFLIKLILLPLNLSAQKGNYLLKEAQIEIDEIKQKYKGDNKKVAEETMRLYKEKKINPFSSIFVIIIQIPIFFALYYVFNTDIVYREAFIYTINTFPEKINALAFGFLDLSKKNIFIAILTGITMFIYTKRQNSIFQSDKKKTDISNKEKPLDFKDQMIKNIQFQMTYFLPIISGFSAYFFPAALGLYWTISNILSIFQDIYIQKKLKIEKFKKEHLISLK